MIYTAVWGDSASRSTSKIKEAKRKKEETQSVKKNCPVSWDDVYPKIMPQSHCGYITMKVYLLHKTDE